MPLSPRLAKVAIFQPVATLAALGVCFAASACGGKTERTRTTNSLADASLDAGADVGVDASLEPNNEAGASSRDSGGTDTTPERPEAGAPSSETLETTTPPETTASDTTEPATSEPPEVTSTGNEDAGGTSTSETTNQTSEPELPASCGNGELEGDEMCCRASDIDSALEARFTAGELLLNGDLGCAPPQANAADNISYEMCGGPCGTDVGCAVSASNVELTYNPSAKNFTGIADVVVEGSVVLTLATLNQSVSCDTAHILFEEVTFSGDLVTEIEASHATIDVRNVESELGIPTVTGCAQGNVISAAFLLMQAPIQTAVAEAIEQALEGTIAQPVQCPY